MQPEILVELEGKWPIYYLKNTLSIWCETKIHTFGKNIPQIKWSFSKGHKRISKGLWAMSVLFHFWVTWKVPLVAGAGSVYPSVKTWVL